MKYLFLSVFAVFASVHLYASYICNKKLRNITKPFLLTSLLGYYCFRADNVSLLVILALVTSWLGDVLLMGNGIKWFSAGGFSFWASHALFIATYCSLTDFSKVQTWHVVLLAAVFMIIVTIIFNRLKPYIPKVIFLPMALYLYTNGMMNMFAYLRFISKSCMPALITAIGALLFFLSDSTLFFVRFKKDSIIKTHFIVMLTYTIGEFLIVYGLT